MLLIEVLLTIGYDLLQKILSYRHQRILLRKISSYHHRRNLHLKSGLKSRYHNFLSVVYMLVWM
jgi:hypothetical protein